MKSDLKGYRIRVVVDYPIQESSEKRAIELAQNIVTMSYSACKIMDIKTITKDLSPSINILFPEGLYDKKKEG